MTIEQASTVDFISIDPTTNKVVLTISDHLTWNPGNNHLMLLQAKINNYLAFIESGELLQTYSEANGRPIVIDVVCQHPVSGVGKGFFGQAASIVRNAGFELMYRVIAD
jgi:CRP-like cAMP-binding protein